MGAVEVNTGYAARLGWTPGDFGQQWFDTQLVQAIATTQTQLGLPVIDGICGPKTYGAVLKQQYATLLAPGSSTTLVELGQAVVCSAKIVWLTNIIDGKAPNAESRVAITEMINSVRGLGWAWEASYTGDGDFEWCGAFAAYVWARSGIRLAIRKTYFASTYRLDRWARYMRVDTSIPNPRPSVTQADPRMIINLDETARPNDAKMPDGSLPRAGDIVMVGGVNTGPGKHITIVESFDPKSGVFTTIEGNGFGLLPSGSPAQGVIRATRRVGLSAGAKPSTYFVRRIIRPSLHDVID